MTHQLTEPQRLRAERRMLIDARLELRAQEAAHWQAFCTTGVHTPNAERSRIKAGLTQLDLALHRLEARMTAIDLAVKSSNAKTLLAHLSDVLRERSLESVWQEAERRLAAQGPSLIDQAVAEVDARADAEAAQRQALIQRLLSPA